MEGGDGTGMNDLIHAMAGLVRAGMNSWHETARLSVLLVVVAAATAGVLLVLH